MYAAFVGMSIILWSGCLGRRGSAGAQVAAPPPVTLNR